jgi:hypothetical protein
MPPRSTIRIVFLKSWARYAAGDVEEMMDLLANDLIRKRIARRAETGPPDHRKGGNGDS